MLLSKCLCLAGAMAAGESIAKLIVEDHHYWMSAPLQIGSNDQVVHVQVDTASSELWVFQVHGNCTSDSSLVPPEFVIGNNVCEAMGAFAPNDSSTYTDLNKSMEISYAGGDRVKGIYGSDQIKIGNVDVKSQIFGVANSSTSPFGVLGLGFDSGITSNDTRDMYPNLPRSLQQQGDIKQVSFGVYLSDNSSQNGSIIFGGYDDAKVSGEFTDIPLIENATTYYVSLTNMTFLGYPLINSTKVALMDTGAANIYVPKDTYQLISTVLGVEQQQGSDVVKCPSDETSVFEFTFGDFSVAIPLHNLVVPLEGSSQYCTLDGISPFDVDFIMMGVPLFRQLYVVFDVDNRRMRFAPVRHTEEENLVSFDAINGTLTNSKSATQSTPSPTISIVLPQSAVPYSSGLFTSASDTTSAFASTSDHSSKKSFGTHVSVTGWLIMIILTWF
ncbi:hypothetical protein DIURU_005060 [Diutina rugosa]|uniref:Peptidase A1 domain-containing protein n=1 Tax=Diutina rugosa TaxID=5481 RepID=A0A642UMU6_DIURU|nr:uncharacterized protein DIURU_005060 [Diutina rugosa]KAA8898205.1 hypothetical protein DIURU_005060 [Diutina rugosa]